MADSERQHGARAQGGNGGRYPTNAIMFAGALLFIAARLMLWISTPGGEEEVEPPVESTAPAIGP